MKIKRIKISNFRSIVKIDLKIDEKCNLISFCGANNVGKTNILNALNLFFGGVEYVPEKDCPNHKYFGTRGGSYQPKIELEFLDTENNKFKIVKDWNKKKADKEVEDLPYKVSGNKNGSSVTEKVCVDFLKRINFFFLPSINISFPESIKYIMNSDVIDIETGKTRMSGKKGEMKNAIVKVLGDLKEILDILGDNISPLLNKYKEGWGVAFDLPTEVTSFRDLMIGEIDFYIKDRSNSKAIDAKGSGLQRLCHILMYFRIIEKLNDKKQATIVCIDEPDVYLHSGLQKQLLSDIKEKAAKNQIFITTHSPIFIDTVQLSNVFLLEQRVEEKVYQRAKRKSSDKKFNAVETVLIDLNESNGVSMLKKYLGIDEKDNLLFDKYNILVEGEEDKIYLEKMIEYFDLNVPNIIPCNGADNIPKFLDFYNGLTNQDSGTEFLVLLDNDSKGREVFKKIKAERYKNINLTKIFVVSFSGFDPKIDNDGGSNLNIEIEDLIDPEVICYLTNKVLRKSKFKELSKKDINDVCKNINRPAFQNSGILSLLENKKNEINPTTGQKLNINSSERSGFKFGIAQIFKELDREIINIIGAKESIKNKSIYEFLCRISKKS